MEDTNPHLKALHIDGDHAAHLIVRVSRVAFETVALSIVVALGFLAGAAIVGHSDGLKAAAVSCVAKSATP